jgi:hypothetical protein
VVYHSETIYHMEKNCIVKIYHGLPEVYRGLPLLLGEHSMRKTISLKLTDKEELLISSMRKEGMSPSMILREAINKYFIEKETQNMDKGYKEVNQVNHFSQEEVNLGDRKVYNKVNQVDQKVNHEDDLLREKVVYHAVNHEKQTQGMFTDQYIDQLHQQIRTLEHELDEWKQRYSTETDYWKETWSSLQTEYQNQVKDSTKRIDEKFDRIMFYIEESRKNPLQSMELSSENQIEKPKKRWSSSTARM